MLPLSIDEIRELLCEQQGNLTLVRRLFPSPYGTVDVMGITDKNLFHYLEEIDPDRRVGLLSELFGYCHRLRHSPEALTMISSISFFTELIPQAMKKVKCQLKKNKRDAVIAKTWEDQLAWLQCFSSFVAAYSVKDLDWMFAMIARSITSERQTFDTERLLWSFCSQYFEYDDLTVLSSNVEELTGIKLDVVQDDFEFPFKRGVPINAQYPVVIEGTEFTDCVEVSVLQFLYMTQPNKYDSLKKIWDDLGSPRKEEVLDFFKMQGSKRANNVCIPLRTKWAEVVQRIPGLYYVRKAPSSTGSNNLELNSGWTNYLRVIAFLKNDKSIWEVLCELCAKLSREKKLSAEMKEIICDCFCKLAGEERIKSIQWIESDPDEGIRDLGNDRLDMLGRIRVLFVNAPEPVDFVMQDGHGYVQWMACDRKLNRVSVESGGIP